jgi:hypothetical protein
MAQGDAFIGGTALLEAGTDRRDHMVSPGESFPRISGSRDHKGVPSAMGQLAAKRAKKF